jgi:hypothetical protein
MPHHTGTNNCIKTFKTVMCHTMVWHSPVLKVLIHLFELTSCMVQQSMVSYIINKNVFMVKLSNISWQDTGTNNCIKL